MSHPFYRRRLHKTRPKPRAPLDFKREFGLAVAADELANKKDRLTTVGASEIFGCLRQAAARRRWPEFAKEPLEPGEEEWGHTERGKVIENFYAVPKMKAMFGDENCFFMGSEQRTFLASPHLSATPDGCAVNIRRNALANYGIVDLGSDDNQIVPEIKTALSMPREAKTRHWGQNQIQIGVLREHTNYKPEYGVILYIHPANLKDIRPFPVKFDPNVYEQGKRRAAKVYDLKMEPKDFAAEGKLPGRTDCQYCEFVEWCNGVEMAKFPGKGVKVAMLEIEPAVRKEMETLAFKVARHGAEEKVAKEAKKGAQITLREMMFDNHTTRIGEADWSLSVSKINGKKSIDKSMFGAGSVRMPSFMSALSANDLDYAEFLKALEAIGITREKFEKVVESIVLDPENFTKEGLPYFRMNPSGTLKDVGADDDGE